LGYDRKFYESRNSLTDHAARRISRLVLAQIPGIRSAVDVGCGVGTWLRTLSELGVTDVFGLDGPWVNRDLLEIEVGRFREVDLEEPIAIDRRFDLAISLEVAEHISPGNAARFVTSLTGLSDIILFSAAIPRQGGVGHLNEQPPAYWNELFSRHGFVQFDTIRHVIWSDDDMPFWYRQNIFLFLSENAAADCALDRASGLNGLHIVHPRKYEDAMKKLAQARKTRIGTRSDPRDIDTT
jgi:SAM-dependent methyltransferase